MRSVFALALALATFLALPASAADTDGVVKSVDMEKMTVTLEDGQTYKLPAEMDASSIEAGSMVVIAYTEIEGSKQITDLFVPE
ncbi:DUF1344 domain-containing protein [Nitratireductor basaltis]|uniref:DUF1344 domain-containing protein n=1 Tax=Nitratireductor basaltis TaxID=472175 RepID=A0A084UCT4_9HYPH|nr:DUF1344 domain-containing protein [Nitratireductor basaltis]KFB10770.1 hypothetical protein EL18_01810 [Nitratireductor basaltis]